MSELKLDWSSLTIKQWKEEIQKGIMLSDKWLYRAIEVIYEGQSGLEKATHTSVDKNGIGFSKFDAPILSDFALMLRAGKKLSKKQKELARSKMIHYWRQLMVRSKLKNDW